MAAQMSGEVRDERTTSSVSRLMPAVSSVMRPFGPRARHDPWRNLCPQRRAALRLISRGDARLGPERSRSQIEPDSAATSPVRMGAGSVRRQCLLCRADEPTGGDGESADHARYRSLEEWSRTRDRECLSTVPVPREPEQAP